MDDGRWWTVFRSLLRISGLGLLGYIAYRYTLATPPEHGTVYGVVFPLSTVLALAALLLAWRPLWVAELEPDTRAAVRVGLTGFGAVWMATGMACTRALASGMAQAPLGGTLDMVHMMSDHIFLPIAVAALAWQPERLARRLGGRVREASPLGRVSYSTSGD